MVRKIAFLALFLLVGAAFMSSCKKEELSSKKEILSFNFEASKNAQLDKIYLGDINGSNISAEVAFGADISQLVPSIEISPRATLSPTAGEVTNFSLPVVYTVTAEDKTTKTFTANVATAPAPYLGNWTGGPIDFGLGLMRVNAQLTQDGAITVEFVNILTNEKDINSFKGSFPPISRQDTDIRVEQTHRWVSNTWSSESCCRTIMYHIVTPQSIKLYYCICNPRTDWLFQLNLNKQ
jgi:hypothetical protein